MFGLHPGHFGAAKVVCPRLGCHLRIQSHLPYVLYLNSSGESHGQASPSELSCGAIMLDLVMSRMPSIWLKSLQMHALVLSSDELEMGQQAKANIITVVCG